MRGKQVSPPAPFPQSRVEESLGSSNSYGRSESGLSRDVARHPSPQGEGVPRRGASRGGRGGWRGRRLRGRNRDPGSGGWSWIAVFRRRRTGDRRSGAGGGLVGTPLSGRRACPGGGRSRLGPASGGD